MPEKQRSMHTSGSKSCSSNTCCFTFLAKELECIFSCRKFNCRKLLRKSNLKTQDEKKSNDRDNTSLKNSSIKSEDDGYEVYFSKCSPTFEDSSTTTYSTYSRGYTRRESQPINFVDPVLLGSFKSRVEEDHICLKNILFRDYGIVGSVVVSKGENRGEIIVRYTTDNWEYSRDLTGTYESTDDQTHTFSFKIDLTSLPEPEADIEFVVGYETSGECFWDTNFDECYSVQWCPKSRSGKYWSCTTGKESCER